MSTLTPEQLIYDLQSQITRLERELEQAYMDIKDFEVLAIEWKKGHRDLDNKHKIKIMEKDQVIDELQDEIDELKAKLMDRIRN
jgi:uncharacterized small protein (DUF1192 family)